MLTVCAVLLILVQAFDLTPLVVPPAFVTLLILYLMFTVPGLLFCACIRYQVSCHPFKMCRIFRFDLQLHV